MLAGGVDLLPYTIKDNQSVANFLKTAVHIRFQLSSKTHDGDRLPIQAETTTTGLFLW